MAESMTLTSGSIAFQSNATVANTLTISIGGGTTYNFVSTSTAQNINLSGFTGWAGSGTSTVTGATSDVTGSITINEGTGSGTRATVAKQINNALTWYGTAASNGFVASSNGLVTGNLNGITSPVSIVLQAGSSGVTVSDSSGSTNRGTISFASGVVTNLGPSTFTYSSTGGTLAACTFYAPASQNNVITVNNFGFLCNIHTQGGSDSGLASTVTVTATNAATTITGGSAADAITVGGGASGMQAITSAVTLALAGGSNTILLDDSLSSTNATVTIFATATTITGWPATITISATGGTNAITIRAGTGTNTYTTGGAGSSSKTLAFYGGTSGSTTFKLQNAQTGSLNSANGTNVWLFNTNSITLTGNLVGGTGSDTLSYAGRTQSITVTVTSVGSNGANGTATGVSGAFANIDAFVGSTSGGAVLDLTGLPAGWTDSGGTVTSGGNSFTHSNFTAVTPYNTVAPAVTPSPATVGQACSCTTGTWTGSPTSYSYQWKLDGGNVGTNGSSYTPVAAGTLTCTVTASNAGGAGTPAVSNSVTVSAAASGVAPTGNPGLKSGLAGIRSQLGGL